MDDFSHRLCFLGHSDVRAPSPRPVMELFSFIKDESHLRLYMETGYAPWWSSPSLRLSFWRPLAGVAHWIDYRLWPHRPSLMHLHNLLWFSLLVWVLVSLYRRWFGEGWIVGAASFCYITYAGFAMPVAWIANRNALMAIVFGVLALWFHDRWRAEGRVNGGLAALGCLLLSLLSAEAGIATGAYLFAYACFLDKTGWRRGLLSLLPYAGLVVAWRIVYRALGYGIIGSSMYLDPLLSPDLYVAAVFKRLPILIMSLWSNFPSSIYIFFTDGQKWLFWGIAVVVVGLVFWVLWPLRRLKLARFFVVGMILSALPVCAVFPDDRSSFFLALGGVGLLGLLIKSLWEPAPDEVQGRVWRGVAWCFVWLHLVVSPLMMPARTMMLPILGQLTKDKARQMPVTEQNKDRMYILLNSTVSLFDMNVGLYRAYLYPPTYRMLHILGPGLSAVDVFREDARTLRLRPHGGFFRVLDTLFRDPKERMRVGDRVKLKRMEVEVLRLLADGRPAEVRFRFRVPLENKALCFLQGGKNKFLVWKPPPIGGRVVLPAVLLP